MVAPVSLTEAPIVVWGGFAASVGTLVGVAVALYQFHRQRVNRDTDEGFGLLDKIHVLWEKVHSNPDRLNFYMGELLVFYEALCGAFVEKRIGKSSREILKKHLKETLEMIATTPHLHEVVRVTKTSSDTYEDIVIFLRRVGADKSTISVYEAFESQGNPNLA